MKIIKDISLINIKTVKVSISRGTAENKACIRIFKPFTLETVLRGLNTLKTLKLETVSWFPDKTVLPVSVGSVST